MHTYTAISPSGSTHTEDPPKRRQMVHRLKHFLSLQLGLHWQIAHQTKQLKEPKALLYKLLLKNYLSHFQPM